MRGPTRFLLLLAGVAAALGGCGGMGGELATDARLGPAGGEVPVSVYKALGSVQCSGGGQTLAELEAQLRAAGVQPLEASCGHTGMMYATVCGAPDGRIGIFDVSQPQSARAREAGFRLLQQDFPDASRTPC